MAISARDGNLGQPVVAARQRANAKANFRHPGTARTTSYGVDVPAMLFQQRG
jgi:hypothetical protein